jgi:hypothetical protein
MAFRFVVDCCGEDHSLTFRDGKLHVDPVSHDVDVERGLIELGAPTPTCLLFLDAADPEASMSGKKFSSHLEWVLWEIELRGMMSDYEFNYLAVDFFRRVVPSLQKLGITLNGIQATDLPRELMRCIDDWDEERMKALLKATREWMKAADSRVLKLSARWARSSRDDDELGDRVRDLKAAIYAAHTLDDATYFIFSNVASSVDVSYIGEAARWAQVAKGYSVSRENEELAIAHERAWQIEHLFKAISVIQEGKPWPSS